MILLDFIQFLNSISFRLVIYNFVTITADKNKIFITISFLICQVSIVSGGIRFFSFNVGTYSDNGVLIIFSFINYKLLMASWNSTPTPTFRAKYFPVFCRNLTAHADTSTGTLIFPDINLGSKEFLICKKI